MFESGLGSIDQIKAGPLSPIHRERAIGQIGPMQRPDGFRSIRATFARNGKGHRMMFTIEFFRIRKRDNARATLDRITHIAADLESAKIKAKSLFDTLNLPQNPDGLRILDQDGHEVFFWTPGTDGR
ncbi:MAG TPA: hypothetical protein VK430_08445 [Xanthobacteraceae bacterium]|nr:hypothetical protein [Xanthobacteraceae bacterium]